MRIIFKYTRCREWIFFAAALLFTAVQVKLELLFPEYLKAITVLIQSDTIDSAKLAVLCGEMLGFVAGSLLCAVLTVLLVSVASSAISARMRQGVFDKIMDFSLEEVAKFTTPSLITRCTFDIMQVQIFISAAPPVLARTILTGIVASAGIFSKNIVWTSITGGSIALMLLFITCLIIFLTLCSSIFALDNNYLSFTITPRFEIVNGSINEYVYDKDCLNTDNKLSQLDWDIKNIPFFSLKTLLTQESRYFSKSLLW